MNETIEVLKSRRACRAYKPEQVKEEDLPKMEIYYDDVYTAVGGDGGRMVVSRTLIKNVTMEHASPAEAIRRVNDLLLEGNDENMFVTVWLGILEISTGKLTYADAGHERMALYQKGAWSLRGRATCASHAPSGRSGKAPMRTAFTNGV